MNKKAWIRILTVELTSRKLKKKLTFGNNESSNFNIDVQGYKYMSTLKDSCTIRITNINYDDIVKIIIGEYYDVKVTCGYKYGNVQTIFKGGVLWASNDLGDRRSTELILLCASDLVARYGQKRMNLTLNSGINMYSAINFICRRAGIKNTNISSQFKKKFLNDVTHIDSTPGSWIENLTNNNEYYIINSDSSTNSVLSIFDSSKSNSRVITLNSDTIDLSGGYPKLTQDGLSLSILPSFSFMCGDTIIVDNSLIDISTSSKSQSDKNVGYFLDENGMYMIFEMDYHLQNRGSAFTLNMVCKSRSLISNYIGR